MKNIKKQKKEIQFKRKAFFMLLIVFVFAAVGVYKNKVSSATTSCKGPADVILAIDNSANMSGTKLSDVKNSSIDFIYKDGTTPSGLFSTVPAFGAAENLDYHQVGLATFNSNVSSWSLTKIKEDIQTVIGSMVELSGSRNITDAISLSRTFLLNSDNYLATKTIVLIVSGGPIDITSAIEEVKIAKESASPVRTITIGVNFDEIVDDGERGSAISFINNQYVLPNDCYYTLASPDDEPGLTMKSTIENCNYVEGSLDASLENIVNKITSAVCDEISPTVGIYRTPSGTLYNVDELTLVSNATDNFGFSDHYIEWIATPPGAPINVINNCSIVGTSVSCSSGSLGLFNAGTKIDYSSHAVDSNSNQSEVIDGVTVKDVTVATVFATIPALLRNVDQEFKININNYPNLANLDNFYIRIDNGALERVVSEQDNASEMTSCSLNGTIYSCNYPLNIDCSYNGTYLNNTLDVYYYVKTGGDFHSGPVFQTLGLPINEPSEGIGFNNSDGNPTCSDGIDNDCDNLIDGGETLACDGTGPTITKIQRASPPEGTDVTELTGSVTIITEANDSNGIKEYEVQFNINSGGWIAKYNCIDIASPSGKCDGDGQTMDSVTSSPIDISSYSPGTIIEFRTVVTDNSGNDISSTSATKSFLIKSSECTGADLSVCTGGQCCGNVCNTSAYNSGPEGPYDEDECTRKTCNGIRLELEPDPTLVGNPSCVFNSGGTDYDSGCYSYQESYANPPDLFGESYTYFNPPEGGCEIRNLRCYNGYCKAKDTDKAKSNDYCGYNSEPLRLANYSCVGGRTGTCNLVSTNTSSICDSVFTSFDWINSYSSDDLAYDVSDSFIAGDANITIDPGSVYETKNVLIRTSASDTSGVDNIVVYLDGSIFKTCNCAGAFTCTCQAEKTLAYSDIGQTFSFYAIGTDINTNTETTDTYNFVVLDSDCSNIVIDDPVTYHIVNTDTAADQDPLTGCGENASVTGECCGGVCNAAISNPNLFNSECYTDTCTGTVWTPNLKADGVTCGGGPSCSPFYTGCRGGNECTAGFCVPDLAGIGFDSCGGTDGKYLTNKGCDLGVCGIIAAATDIDCSIASDFDGNDTVCNCDCGGYDIEEKTYSSLEFDGVDDYVEIPNSSSLDITGNNISCVAWVYIGDQNSDVGIITKGPLTNEESYMLGIKNDEKPRMRVYTDSFTQAVADNPLTQNQWHHLVGTYNGYEVKIYVDGTLSKSELKNGNINSSSNPVLLGRRVIGDNRYYNGLMDDVRIYDRVLSGQEIADQYDGIFFDNTNLIGHWNLDKGSGGTVTDSSINGNDGALSSPNGPSWKKYHSTSSSGLTGNVPLHWQVCNDGIDNDCNGAFDNAANKCDGIVNSVTVDAQSLRIDITQATAIAELLGGSVSNITFTGGLNYVTAPTITIIGDGTGASATSVIDTDGVISAINISDGGSGYTTIPTVVITEGNKLTNISGNINDSDISTVENKFTISTDSFDDSNILQSSIEWTVDDWTTTENNACSGGICNVCISGGDCENENNGQVFSAGADTITVNDKDWIIGEWAGGTIEITYADATTELKTISSNTEQTITADSNWSHAPIPDATSSYVIKVKKDLINTTFLSANKTFKYRSCATDNSVNHNYRCTNEYSISIIDTNRVPTVENLIVVEPQLCGGSFNYKLEWEFTDDDLTDSQKYYEIQVKEANDDFSIGPLILNYKGGNSEYHFVQSGGNMRSDTVKSSGVKKLFDDDATWIKNEWQGGTIEIVGGTGTDNGIREIISNEATEIVVADNWITDPDATSFYEIKSVDLEYGGKTYYWRVRVTDDKSGGLEKVSDWGSPNGHGPLFTTPPHEYPDVDFVAVNDDSDQCAYDEGEDVTSRCSFGEEIHFEDISNVVECLNDSQCLYSDKAMCNSDNDCDACTDSSQCTKFGDYTCVTGVCLPSGTFECSVGTPCKTLDLFKCNSTVCSPCEDDTDCDGGFQCDDNGKCIETIIRQWDFYDNATIDSIEEDPINIYIESKKDFYTVILYRQDISGQSCPKRKNIPFEGRKYPKWNEVSSSN